MVQLMKTTAVWPESQFQPRGKMTPVKRELIEESDHNRNHYDQHHFHLNKRSKMAQLIEPERSQQRGFRKGVPILPQDSYQKAVARFWAKFIDDKVLVMIIYGQMISIG